MKRGEIAETAKRQTADLFHGVLVLLVICFAVLGWNWKYCYNAVTGPYPFTSELSKSPGAREFVRVAGPFLPTGMSEQVGVGLRGNPARIKVKNASYLMTVIDRRVLIVKVDPDFSGNEVEGALRALPEEIRGAVGERLALHPWLVEAVVGYRVNANIFVMIAVPLTVLLLIALPMTAWRASHPDRHPALARLKALGDPTEILEAIENDVTAAGEAARCGPFWFARSWLVSLEPFVLLVPLKDLIGVGCLGEAHKSRRRTEIRYTVRLWTRGQALPDKVRVAAAEARDVMARVQASLPWALVEDPQAFDRRWREDRASCEHLSDSRRTATAMR